MYIIQAKKNEKEAIQQTVKILRKGGIAVVPSDTVYGLSVDATNKVAVEKLIRYKSRPPGKAISIFTGTLERTKEYVTVSNKQEKIISTMVPGQYTFIFPSTHKIDKKLESERGTLGIRVPDFQFINGVVKAFGKPITATSANISGTSPHYSIDALLKATPKSKQRMIDAIIDYGKLPRNKPSTVIDFTEGDIRILRQGDMRFQRIAHKSVKFQSISEGETKQIAKSLLQKNIQKSIEKPVVIMLFGEMGAGKTVFVKGIGEYLGIDRIISPTFVIYYEYHIQHHYIHTLYHVDLYKIEDQEEFEHLGLEEVLKPANLMCVEWSEKSEGIFKILNEKAYVISVHMKHIDETRREIIIR
ncbi:hypothetical protein A3H80_00075 [Candidatus Roizmanbacteria bacterium RIFCSPLOWO2_02_FULL_37_19]|uniref:L-threonylcarbamoyladenylate synthase n=1 Tax=Candidatus Roizmanbacteria bacterium RIFCSPHIGHO2_02_FULL_37_24 TaxID=1802037 RepID=A0A1F7GVV7_9BACT|nr:MAG: hypothetical protein A2862_01330 [Candidatus Roizmanbacteria bacterium RIFCSPHIGHO2_01_FULL_38_41]OGK22612.1 MAG: hypothetical protein A3C24_04560 [Candidatus Roizmanbacteria bacterium RIFCSPHIGHO2_02_FULL_37_24]OGK31893.1 MAG: hypothetical protein A3E10_05605 [Candidatus Roizmanbacteria bacterium RIFCSPHIGHO2_12_FULL_37_23]OGK53924.1 MAG: hypothetical protein A3H80_00075 [Candidatus Roizmanbacteria bacterium RIFCSPLOWO2_02_FULL_37_19]OGK61838.1 MAG: hypothetical protein A3G65_04240 [Ca